MQINVVIAKKWKSDKKWFCKTLQDTWHKTIQLCIMVSGKKFNVCIYIFSY